MVIQCVGMPFLSISNLIVSYVCFFFFFQNLNFPKYFVVIASNNVSDQSLLAKNKVPCHSLKSSNHNLSTFSNLLKCFLFSMHSSNLTFLRQIDSFFHNCQLSSDLVDLEIWKYLLYPLWLFRLLPAEIIQVVINQIEVIRYLHC